LLGYVAYGYVSSRRSVNGYSIIIVSSKKSPNELAVRVDDFLQKFDFSEEEFNVVRNGLIEEKS
jgi:secreted Zn-dependent insulinase-like peptidase